MAKELVEHLGRDGHLRQVGRHHGQVVSHLREIEAPPPKVVPHERDEFVALVEAPVAGDPLHGLDQHPRHDGGEDAEGRAQDLRRQPAGLLVEEREQHQGRAHDVVQVEHERAHVRDVLAPETRRVHPEHVPGRGARRAEE